MPMILVLNDHAAWLGEDAVRAAPEPLSPQPSEALRAYLVSTAVMSTKNYGRIEPGGATVKEKTRRERETRRGDDLASLPEVAMTG